MYLLQKILQKCMDDQKMADGILPFTSPMQRITVDGMLPVAAGKDGELVRYFPLVLWKNYETLCMLDFCVQKDLSLRLVLWKSVRI
jgi:hypothetical protein